MFSRNINIFIILNVIILILLITVLITVVIRSNIKDPAKENVNVIKKHDEKNVSKKRGNKFCSNPIPGSSTLSLGIDGTSLALTPDISFTGDKHRGLRRRLIKFTCNKNEKWTDTVMSLKYDHPEQVSVVTTQAAGSDEYKNYVYTEINEVKLSLAASAGLKAKFVSGMFSTSIAYEYKRDTLSKEDAIIIEFNSVRSLYRIDLRPYYKLELDDDFSIYVNDILPEVVVNNSFIEYEKLVDMWGTHFFSSGFFGGQFHSICKIDKKHFKKFDQHKLIVDVQQELKDVYNRKGSFQFSHSKTYETIELNKTTQIRYYGGSVGTQNMSENNWSQSIHLNPWLYGCELENITLLIENEKKRKILSKVIKDYFDRKHRNDIELIDKMNEEKKREEIVNIQQCHDKYVVYKSIIRSRRLVKLMSNTFVVMETFDLFIENCCKNFNDYCN